MEQTPTSTSYRQVYKSGTITESKELSEKLKKATPSARKIEKAKEIISKLDPEQFKAITGRDLYKK